MGFSGLMIGTSIFIALEIVFAIGICATPKQGQSGLRHTLFATSVMCCWMMWAMVYSAQMTPLINPVLVKPQ